jgi:hypothetical protein
MRRMTDVHYTGDCESPDHPGLIQLPAGLQTVIVNGEPTNLQVGSYTTLCPACERWIETLVEGPMTV